MAQSAEIKDGRSVAPHLEAQHDNINKPTVKQYVGKNETKALYSHPFMTAEVSTSSIVFGNEYLVLYIYSIKLWYC